MVSITHNVQWQAILAVPVNKEQFSEIFGGQIRATGNDMDVRAEATSEGSNAVKTSVNRKGPNKVDSSTEASSIRDGKGMERSMRPVGW